MKILIAPDKFKGSLSAYEVCQSIGEGLQIEKESIEVIYHPMADGGDGSLAILSDHLKLKAQTVDTTDPLGRAISTQYYTSSDAAFIEVASASGIVLLSEEERNPLMTSTFGTGKMLLDAINKGFQHIYLFLGGSATNDAGMGIAAALGCQFLDEQNEILKPIGSNLSRVKFIKTSKLIHPQEINITLLCDVTNTLHGPNGAAHVYARQKGATDEQIQYLDDGLKHFSSIIEGQLGIDVSTFPGSGAAGGIGAGMHALFGASLEKGFTAISKLTGLEQQIQSCDMVISGEGKLDMQSLQGKVIDGIAKLCEKHEKPLALFVGKSELEEQHLRNIGVQTIYTITGQANDLEDAMLNGATYLRKMASDFSNNNFNRAD